MRLAEGYASALDVRRALGGTVPVVTAFDSGNLEPVAKALRERYPDKPILIVGDDDPKLVEKTGINPGRVHATAAARAVNGHVFFPTFLPDSEGTDFNDLMRSPLGESGARRQLAPVFERLVTPTRTLGRRSHGDDEPQKLKPADPNASERRPRLRQG